jgi:hypothetical protein
MTEPGTTLTDYALAVECVALAVLLARRPCADPVLRCWWLGFFASAGVAPLLGGTVHGFFHGEDSWLWPATLLAIGATACTAWAIGARLLFAPHAARAVAGLALLGLAVYALVVLAGEERFGFAIAGYAPAALFLLVAFARRRVHAGTLGLVLTAVAAAVQQLGFGLHPQWFDHNAVYHLVQGVALVAIFAGACATLGGTRADET